MTLATGTRVGSYEVLGPLGAGGMGEVYRARDLNLDRSVAIKILPQAVAADPDRLARFEREAKTLALLNHPHIAHVHGFEASHGTRALVMELVEGPTLADRIARGAIPVDEAVAIARQIAEALEAAHDAGIIHRDLKPANIKVRPDGTVKVLDFGLAKLSGTAGDAEWSGARDGVAIPTITTPALTAMGAILGTAAYMSPEQAKGRPLDRRVDIWAFGCVLYEMLTGRRAFPGDDVTDTLAAIVRAEPDWTALPAATPLNVRRLLRRALEKDLGRRLRCAGDVAIECTDNEPAVAAAPRRSTGSWVGVAAALVVTVAAAVAGVGVGRRQVGDIRVPLARFALTLPPVDNVGVNETPRLAMSRDGTRLVTLAGKQLHLRRLDALDPVVLPGIELPVSPTFSPDGEHIAFWTVGGLQRARLGGGGVMTLASVGIPVGLWWGSDGYIYGANEAGLFRVRDAGGTAEIITAAPSGQAFGFPQLLPGGDLLYASTPYGSSVGEIIVRAPAGHETVLHRGARLAAYVKTGYLLVGSAGVISAARYDLGSRKVVGSFVPLIEGVTASVGTGVMQFVTSDTGHLAYAVGGIQPVEQSQIVLVSPSAQMTVLPMESHAYSDPRVSPDGRTVALHRQDAQNDVWTGDIGRGTLTRHTFGPGEDETPVWSPDGQWIAYAASRDQVGRGIYRRRISQSDAPEELVYKSQFHMHVRDWTPDGRTIIFEQLVKGTMDVWMVDLSDQKARPILRSEFTERASRLSPDGRWIAFDSDESGRAEVYIQAFPGPGRRVRISTDGGAQPIWSRDGRRLFFRRGDAVYQATFLDGGPPDVSIPRRLFADTFLRPQGATHTSYDAMPDGRLLMLQREKLQQPARQMAVHVVLNWFQELKARVP